MFNQKIVLSYKFCQSPSLLLAAGQNWLSEERERGGSWDGDRIFVVNNLVSVLLFCYLFFILLFYLLLFLCFYHLTELKVRLDREGDLDVTNYFVISPYLILYYKFDHLDQRGESYHWDHLLYFNFFTFIKFSISWFSYCLPELGQRPIFVCHLIFQLQLQFLMWTEFNIVELGRYERDYGLS